MDFPQIIAEIRDTGVYTPDEWGEFLGYFDEPGVMQGLSKAPSAEGSIVRRIQSGAGCDLDAPVTCSSPKYVTAERLAERVTAGELSVGIVSGVFDLLHLGHLEGIAFAAQRIAKQPRSALCVLTLSDCHVRERKGPSRPVLDVNERLAMLTAVGLVNYAIVLEQPHCLTAIECLRPKWFFKSKADFGRPIVQQEIQAVESVGGRVEFFPPELGKNMSTTELIGRIGREE